MLYGENKPFNVAIVVPDMASLERWAKHEHRPLGDPKTDPKILSLLQSELDKHSQHFKGYERPKKLMVTLEDFTIENGHPHAVPQDQAPRSREALRRRARGALRLARYQTQGAVDAQQERVVIGLSRRERRRTSSLSTSTA